MEQWKEKAVGNTLLVDVTARKIERPHLNASIGRTLVHVFLPLVITTRKRPHHHSQYRSIPHGLDGLMGQYHKEPHQVFV